MNPFIILLCMVALGVMPLSAQHSDWQIQTTEGKEMMDISLLSLAQDSLAVSSSGFNGQLSISSIRRLSRGGGRAGLGAFLGGVFGGTIGYFIGNRTEETYRGYPSTGMNPEVEGTLIGAGIGGVLGALSGQFTDKETHKLGEKTHQDKLATLRIVLRNEGREVTDVGSLERDVVELKNGNVVSGSVTELIPDSTVRVVTAEGRELVFSMSEVSRVSKEYARSTSSAEEAQPVLRESQAFDPKFSFSLGVGVGFPVGQFAKTSGDKGGAAQVGVTVGGDIAYRFNESFEWLTSLNYSAYSIDESALGLSSNASVGSWKIFWPMTGIRLSSQSSEDQRVFCLAQVGLFAAKSPEITASTMNGSFFQMSSSSPAFAFSLGAGLVWKRHFTFWARYASGEPEFNITASGVGPTGSSTVLFRVVQPISVLLAGVGYVF